MPAVLRWSESIKSGAAVKTDGVKRVVQVEQVVAVFAHDGGNVVKDAGVGRLRAVRRAQKERLHAETLRLRAERAQILFVRHAERQRPDIGLKSADRDLHTVSTPLVSEQPVSSMMCRRRCTGTHFPT